LKQFLGHKLKKQDFPPLFAPGIHKLTVAEFEKVVVSPFQDDHERKRLFLLFEQWIHKLRLLNVTGVLWIDGSFVTSKFAPGDIDCILWYPSFSVTPTIDQEKETELLIDRLSLKAQYDIDFYMESPEPSKRLARESAWRGLFGFQHDGRSPKGFVELSI
jgi:hypothetical protein